MSDNQSPTLAERLRDDADARDSRGDHAWATILRNYAADADRLTAALSEAEQGWKVAADMNAHCMAEVGAPHIPYQNAVVFSEAIKAAEERGRQAGKSETAAELSSLRDQVHRLRGALADIALENPVSECATFRPDLSEDRRLSIVREFAREALSPSLSATHKAMDEVIKAARRHLAATDGEEVEGADCSCDTGDDLREAFASYDKAQKEAT